MKILIAEDEPDIAMAYKIALERRNHQVVLAENGEECLKAYGDALKHMSNSDSVPFDAVVVDYRMPKKDGMEVAMEILALNPHQRLIFASAYVKDALVDSVKQLKKIVELMPKPFELDALVGTIEDKEIYAGLKKLNLKVHQITDLDPQHQWTRDLFEELHKIQKYDVWYVIGDTVFG
ncbi:MAG: response regulator [Nitrososphaerales archaeon]